MKLTFISLIFLILTPCYGFSQNVTFFKFKFISSKSDYSEALLNLKKGDSLFYLGEPFYSNALPYYKKANDLNPLNSFLNFKLGKCFLANAKYEKAVEHFKKSGELAPKKRNTTQYYTGLAYQHSNNFLEAIKYYDNYKTIKYLFHKKAIHRITDKRISECINGNLLIKSPLNLKIEKLNKPESNALSYYTPIYNSEETRFLATIRTNDNLYTDNKGFEEIVYTGSDENIPTLLTELQKINSHLAIVNKSLNEKYIILYTSDNGGDLLISEKNTDNMYTTPLAFPEIINSTYHESSGYISDDGKTLYFCSTNPVNNVGGADIFKSTKDSTGNWQVPVNMGNQINSLYDEDAVFIHPDLKTIYFSSNGPKSIGGFDILKAELSDSGYVKYVENIGYPINSTRDELYFNVPSKGYNGYFSSDRTVISGHLQGYKLQLSDIYYLRSFISGTITDSEFNKPLKTSIKIYDEDYNLIKTAYSDSVTGKFNFTVPAGTLTLTFISATHLLKNEKIKIPEPKMYQYFTINSKMVPIKEGVVEILEEIEFDFNASTLVKSSEPGLSQLAEYLIANPGMEIEISGHTDNKGTYKYNKQLSLDRATSVRDFLVKKGVAAKQLSVAGYAYDKPIVPNTTDENRQRNRRVELKILKK